MKELILLGASGSIGTQTLDIVREFNDKFQVLGLSVGSDLEKAKKIIEEFKPKMVVTKTLEDLNELKNLFKDVDFDYGDCGLINLATFEKEFFPIFSYKVKETEIKKIVCMEYGKNTVCVYYRIKNGDYKAKLKLAPIVNFRDFHSMNTNHTYKISQTIDNRKVKLTIDDNNHYPIYMYTTEGNYIEHYNDIFKNERNFINDRF